MFLVKTYVGPSTIHGAGVFAAEPIKKGTVMWRFEPLIDRIISQEVIDRLPQVAKDYIEEYGYTSEMFPGGMVMSGDHARYINHHAKPNTDNSTEVAIALRDIAAGEEITCDYRDLSEHYAELPYVGERAKQAA